MFSTQSNQPSPEKKDPNANQSSTSQQPIQTVDLNIGGLPTKPANFVTTQTEIATTVSTEKANTEADKASAAKQSKKDFLNTYVEPKPNRAIIWMTGPLARQILGVGFPVLRNIPVINKLPPIRGVFRVQAVDFAERDRAIVDKTVNRNTVAFIPPNHPEFGTDWIIDKIGCAYQSPMMAHWADKGIVNGFGKLVQKFLLGCNVIANCGGEAAKDYSVRWAMQGHGVLAHSEGRVHWTSNHIHPNMPGIRDMAMEAAERVINSGSDKPVYIQPMISKLNYTRDVKRELGKEMGQIEKRLGFPVRAGLPIQERFAALQVELLKRREEKFGLSEELRKQELTPENFFDRQKQLYKHIYSDLKTRYDVEEGAYPEKMAYRMYKAVTAIKYTDREQYKADIKKASELDRLCGFTEECYGHQQLTQEEIGESLKRIKRDIAEQPLVSKVGWGDMFRKFVPIPVAERVAHIRAAEPIEVTALLRAPNVDREAVCKLIDDQMRANMQATLDQVNNEISPVVGRFVVPNPFHKA